MAMLRLGHMVSLLLISACVVAGNLQVWAEEHEPPATEQPGASQEQQTQRALTDLSATQAGILETIRRIQHQYEARAEQQRADNESWVSPAMVNRGLFVVGFAYTVLACLQWAAIRRQGTVASDALRHQQRPWITVLVPIPSMQMPIRQPIELTIEIRNTGHSPALQMTGRATWSSSAPRDPPPDSVPEVPMPLSVLGPQSYWMVPLPAVREPQIVNEAWMGNGQFWIYGIIQYRDVFRLSQPYVTKFCFRLYVSQTLRDRPSGEQLEMATGRQFIQESPYNDCT